MGCIKIKFKIEFQRNRNEHVEQERLTLPEHLSSPSVLSGVLLLDLKVYVYCFVVCPVVYFYFTTVLSVLRFTNLQTLFAIVVGMKYPS